MLHIYIYIYIYDISRLKVKTLFVPLIMQLLRQLTRLLLLRLKYYSVLYRVIHEERSILRVLIVSVIVRKEVYKNLCVILDC